MATFRKRGKTWEYRIRYVDPITGLKAEKSKGGFRVKADAEYAAAEVTNDIKYGKKVNLNSNITLADYIDIWFETYKATVKETTVRSRSAYIVRIKKIFENLKLKNLSLTMYQKKLNDLSKIYKKNSLATLNQIMQMVVRQAVTDGYFQKNPIKNVKFPYYNIQEEKVEFWELQTVRKFEKICREDINKKRKKGFEHVSWEKERDLAMYYLMTFAGLRIGETCALSINDYYPVTKEVNITKTLNSAEYNQVKNSWKIYPPKNRNSYRVMPLPEIAYTQVEKWIKLRKEYADTFDSVFVESNFIFCKRDGTPVNPRDIREKFDAILRKHKLPRLTPHGLRHTYASLQIQAGIDPKSLQMLLGHGDIKTTLNIYAHLTKTKKKENIDRFESMLKSTDSDGGAKAGQTRFKSV